MIRHIIATRKRRIAASATTMGLVAAIAFAAWLVDGEGPARGKVAELQALVVDATVTPGDACYPNGTCDMRFRVTNPNPGALVLTDVVNSDGGEPFVIANGHPANCAQYLSLNGGVIAEQPIPSGGPTEFTVPNGFKLTDAPTACQGSEFTKMVKVKARTP